MIPPYLTYVVAGKRSGVAMTVDVYTHLYKVVKKYSVSNMLYKTIKKKKNKKIIK